jgi:predicted short-subunit dehydrogenase-like oxidoreductase (DUF2520 family)
VAAAHARPSVAILGCGAVGEALAWKLAKEWKRARKRADLLLWSRRRERAEELCDSQANATVRVRPLAAPEEALGASEAVLLCLPDAVIVPMADRLARSIPSRRRIRPAVLHTNGLLGPEALNALRVRGAAVGKLHPLWATNRAHYLMDGVSFGIDGDPRAMREARAIIRSVGGRPVPLRKDSGPEYHAAASLLSGGIVALYELADRLFLRAVPALSERRRAFALGMLAKTSLFNVWQDGTTTALTGAIARGAEETVRGHLLALRGVPAALEAYQVLGRTMLELARKRGSIDAATHRRLALLIRAPARKR